MVCLFWALNITGDMFDFVQISTILGLKKKLNLNEILNISGKNDSAKKADHILEIQELGEFCGHCFKNQTCSKG